MLIYSMSVSVDGYIADRDGDIGWSPPSEELFAFHLARARELGLVDELRIFRVPVVLGGGTPYLPPVTQAIPLEMVEIRTFSSRVGYERYRRVHADPA